MTTYYYSVVFNCNTYKSLLVTDLYNRLQVPTMVQDALASVGVADTVPELGIK